MTQSGYLSIYERFPAFLKRRINPLEEALHRDLEALGRRQAGSLVVDAGAGESRFRRHFGACRYLALDLGVGDAQWDYSAIDVCGNLVELPLKTGCADLVLNTQVLEHVPEPQRVIDELLRILKPGGILYLTAPQGWHEHQQPYDFYRFTRFALRRMLENSGFQQIRVEPAGGYFHYLGQRFTYIPKILFQGRRGPLRWLLLPFELAALAVCCVIAPILCFYLDRLDRKKEFTLIYRCWAFKPLSG